MAAGYYHGGPSQKNWGKKTQAYIDKVNGFVSGFPADTSTPEVQYADASSFAPPSKEERKEDKNPLAEMLKYMGPETMADQMFGINQALATMMDIKNAKKYAGGGIVKLAEGGDVEEEKFRKQMEILAQGLKMQQMQQMEPHIARMADANKPPPDQMQYSWPGM